ncbi:MAG TPA: hypothetical protein VJ506_02035 [Candidatus Limnocylindrales bacterium]|nr:hypothetical protein [Candidatus Limnocylindrales bacterium]
MFEKFERFSMSKAAIARLFKVAVAFVVTGAVSGAAVWIWAVANGAIALGGPQFVTFNPATIGGAIVGLTVASLLTSAGTVAAVVSWAGALLNTSRLENKTWFITLLGLGLVSLGWVAMIAYIVKGPEDASLAATRAATAAS